MRVLLRDCLKISKLALAENEQSVYLHIELLNKNLDQEKNESEKIETFLQAFIIKINTELCLHGKREN